MHCASRRYEGLIDEVIGIENGLIYISAAVLDEARAPRTNAETVPPFKALCSTQFSTP